MISQHTGKAGLIEIFIRDYSDGSIVINANNALLLINMIGVITFTRHNRNQLLVPIVKDLANVDILSGTEKSRHFLDPADDDALVAPIPARIGQGVDDANALDPRVPRRPELDIGL